MVHTVPFLTSGKLTQQAYLTTPLRNLTLFRFLLMPKFHMTRPLLSSSWEVFGRAHMVGRTFHSS